LLLDAAIKKAEAEVEDLPEVRNFIKFIKESERGVCR
jgi:acyl-[acyl carrier protein]--UDP-N-acetylglucosamine O-acyltransferase